MQNLNPIYLSKIKFERETSEVKMLKKELKKKHDLVKRLEKEIVELNNTEKLINEKQGEMIYGSMTSVFNCDSHENAYKNNGKLTNHMKINHDKIPQVDGLDTSLNESKVDEKESTSLSRLMALTDGLNSFQFR